MGELLKDKIELFEEPTDSELDEIEKAFVDEIDENAEFEGEIQETSLEDEDTQDVVNDGSNLGDDSDDEQEEAEELDDYEESEDKPTCSDDEPFDIDDITLLKGELRSFKRLSKEEEVDLAKRMEQGDEGAREQLISSTGWLAMYWAKKLSFKGLSYEDKVQEGLIGIVQAADNYDYRKNTRFSTYATFYIKKCIKRAGWANGAVSIPEKVGLEINNMKKAFAALEQKLQRKPKVDEVAEYLQISPSRVRELCEFEISMVELQSPLDSDDGEGELLDRIADEGENPAEFSAQLELRKMIGEKYQSLSQREKKVVDLYYGCREEDFTSSESYIPMRQRYTLQEIGNKLGISKQAVSQMLNKIKAKAK